MTVSVYLSPPPILQFFNNAGQPNSGGSVLTQVGGVNYPTYEDSQGTIPLPNPIPLNSRGEISNAAGASKQLFLANGVVYTFTIYDSNNNQIDQATWVSSGGIFSDGSLSKVISSIATLRTLSHLNFTEAYVTGYYSQGDGGGGQYYYDASDTTSADNGGTIIVASDNSRWKLSTSTIITCKQFGAKGDGVTNDSTFIQNALNTNKSIRVTSGNYFLGTADTGNFLNLKANDQCIYFDDGASFTANGNNGVSNNAAIVSNDGFSGCYLYNPRFISNGTVLTSDTRDSPYGYLVQCTSQTVNGVGIINGYGNKVQAVFQAALPTYNNAFDVNGVDIDYTADTCFYGAGFSGTGNCVRGKINAIDCHRAYIGYGCYDHDLLIKSLYVNMPVARLQHSVIGAGVLSGLAKDTYGIKLKYVVNGNPTYTGLRFVIEAAYFTADGAAKPKIYDIELDYNDKGVTAGGSISFQYSLDGVLQTSYTGNVFDRFTIKGNCYAVFDLTSQGAIATPLTQTTLGYCNLEDLNIPNLSGINDPTNGYLFNGIRPHWAVDNITYTPIIKGTSTTGVGTYSVQYGRASRMGKRVFFDLNLTWSAHTGTGNMTVGLGTLTSAYPVVNNSGYVSVCQIAASNLTYGAQLVAIMQQGSLDCGLYTFATGGSLSQLVLDTAATLYISGSYEIDT